LITDDRSKKSADSKKIDKNTPHVLLSIKEFDPLKFGTVSMQHTGEEENQRNRNINSVKFDTFNIN